MSLLAGVGEEDGRSLRLPGHHPSGTIYIWTINYGRNAAEETTAAVLVGGKKGVLWGGAVFFFNYALVILNNWGWLLLAHSRS